jgi:hypothetical protein
MASSGSHDAARKPEKRSRNTRGCPTAYRRRFRFLATELAIRARRFDIEQKASKIP